MTFSLRRLISLASLAFLFMLAACGTSTTGTSSTVPASGTSAAAPGESNLPGGEAAVTSYQDSNLHISINRPATWTQDTMVTQNVKFIGGDDIMTLEFPTTSSGTDPLTYAKRDMATFSTSLPGFKQLSLIPSPEVPSSAVLSFASQGVSSITGKTYNARGDRYYILLSDGRLAILTINGPNNHYDRESIRDIALTLKTTR